MTQAESALERHLSRELMQSGAVPKRRSLEAGETLVAQGEAGDELYLLLDGVVAVEVDGDEVAEIGPGAILGERAVLEGGKRMATLQARTRVRVGVVPADAIDREAIEKLAAGRRPRG